MVFQKESRRVWNLVIVLALISFSQPARSIETKAQSRKADPREELIRSLKGANVQNFDFATNENDAQATAMLTNRAARQLIRLGKSDTNFVVQYTSVKDKKTNTTKIYKAEVVKRDKSLSLVITDVGSQTISKQILLVPDDDDEPTEFNGTKEDCFKDFNCGKRRAEIQCQVNQTCVPVSVHVICCEAPGNCVSYVVLVSPAPPYCEFLQLLPLPGIALEP